MDESFKSYVENNTNGLIGVALVGGFNHTDEVFTDRAGIYIGSVKVAEAYLKNGWKICEDYPREVIEDWSGSTLSRYIAKDFNNIYFKAFTIGDRIFDLSYTPVKKDFDTELWESWEKESAESGEPFFEVFPTYLCDKDFITKLDEAKEAANRYAFYLNTINQHF